MVNGCLTGYQYLIMGDKIKAKEEYEIFNHQYPESPYVKDAKRLIERIRGQSHSTTSLRSSVNGTVPTRLGKVIDTQVSTIDIVPTVLELVKVEPNVIGGQSPTSHGRSLVGLILNGDRSDVTSRQSPSLEEREAYSETSIQDGYRSVRTGRFKMIYRVKDEKKELYDLKGDPEELIEVSKTRQDEVKVLSKSLLDWFDKTKEYVTGHSEGKYTEPDEEKKKKLKSLGYLQ